MNFASVTEWQAEEYTLRVTAGTFSTRLEAEAFGNQPLRLVRRADCLYLLDASTGEQLAQVSGQDVKLERPKAIALGKTMVSAADYEPVEIPIERYGDYLSLASFSSLAYGVVEIPATLRAPAERVADKCDPLR